MNESPMWKWEDWSEAAEKTVDLSYEANEQGLIPLECPGKLPSTTRTCSTKLFDSLQKRRKNGVSYQRVCCLLCGWGNKKDQWKWRKIGIKAEKRG